jgi:GNAT superfamily N-acetyltransferase
MPLLLKSLHLQQTLCFDSTMKFALELATSSEASAIAILRNSVSDELTRTHGRGSWSAHVTERGVLYAMRHSKVFIARDQSGIVATLQLATKKPWAIDVSYFSPCRKPVYLLAMAVAPSKQRQGVGADCLRQARQIAKAWPADAIRLDAFNAEAGAGAFYARCGWEERGRVSYRGVPLIYYELLLNGV